MNENIRSVLYKIKEWPIINKIKIISSSVKRLLSSKKAIIIIIIAVLILGFAWNQFTDENMDNSVAKSLKGAVLSALSFGDRLADKVTKLSTGDSEDDEMDSGNNKEILGIGGAEIGWQLRKADTGDSIWSIYQKEVTERMDVSRKNQTINGLKNLTVLKNNIPVDNLKNNSLTDGQEYLFLSDESQTNYAAMLEEANQKIDEGIAFNDLEKEIQTAYLIANPSSYQDLFDMPSEDLAMFLE